MSSHFAALSRRVEKRGKLFFANIFPHQRPPSYKSQPSTANMENCSVFLYGATVTRLR